VLRMDASVPQAPSDPVGPSGSPRPETFHRQFILPNAPSSPPRNASFPPTVPTSPSGPQTPFYSESPMPLSTIYNLALADRMRQLSSLQLPFPPFPPFLHQHPSPVSLSSLPFPPRFSPPADLALFPMAKLDPRLFRVPFPEEPKPQHSYIGLISMAILSSPEKKLVLADIYQYILDNYLYFRHRGPGWRNSIRHNLSLNDCFIKAGRAANGKGHYWAVHPACVSDFQKGDFRRRRAQRKVRRHMGLHVEEQEEDEDTPPASPSMSPPASPPEFHTTPYVECSQSHILAPAVKIEQEREEMRTTTTTTTGSTGKGFNFGVDFLLGNSLRQKPDVKNPLCG